MMHLKNHYLNLIQRAKKEDRQKGQGVYFEEHHIIPKCLNGTDDEDNLVLLTAKEHYVAHHLLHKIYKNNKSLFLAYHYMCFTKNEKNITATEYENLRKLNQQYNLGENNPNYKNKQNLSGSRNHRSIAIYAYGELFESISQAALKLNLSKTTIRYWLKRGSEKFYKKVLDNPN